MHRAKVVLNQKINFKTKKTRGKTDKTTIKKLPGIYANLNETGCPTFTRFPKIYRHYQRGTICLSW
jgi:hypothetical protein